MLIDFKQQVVDYLATREDPVKLNKILRNVGMHESDRPYLRDLLSQLVKEGKVIRDGVRFWIPHGKDVSLAIKREKTAKTNETIGRLSINRYGEGFVANTQGGRDWFIPPHSLGNAKTGDTVRVRRVGKADSDKPVGEVLAIETFGISVAVGIFQGHDREARFIPFGDLKIDRQSLIDFPKEVQEDTVGKFDRQQNGTWVFSGFLGTMDDPAVDEAIVLAENQITDAFPAEVLAACDAFSDFQFLPESRTDFRDKLVFTIDGETARDFDDALHLTKLPDGTTEVGIHIADVAHFVPQGSVLDTNARDRGNSVYLPHRAIPMLPERLSTELCSLKPNEPRYTLSVIAILDEKAQVKSSRIVKGIIQSSYRLTYTLVEEICTLADKEKREQYAPVAPPLDLAMALSHQMKERRNLAGGLVLDMPEVRATLNDEGLLAGIQLNQQSDSNRLIEAFMCLANECVAKYMSDLEIDIPYRVHDTPEPSRLEDLAAFWKARGFAVPPKLMTQPGPALNEMIEHLKDNPSGEVLQLQILKSLKLAEYSPENRGHFGLASEFYAHFTSPIRRYADLVIHQRLTYLLSLKDPRPELFDNESLGPICTHISKRERAAGKAEQSYLQLKQLRHMLGEVGNTFNAVIVEVKPFGAFVRLLPLHAVGLMHMDVLTDDTYEVDPESLALVGKRSGKTLRVADPLKVRVDLVDLLMRRINVSPLNMTAIKKPKFFMELKKHLGSNEAKGKKKPRSVRKKR